MNETMKHVASTILSAAVIACVVGPRPAIAGTVIDDNYRREICKGGDRFEVDAQIPKGYALTGFGARVRRNGARVTTVRLEFRKVNPDGSLGPRVTKNFSKKPNHPVEQWITAPDGHVITGLGTRCKKYNITHIKMTYQRIGLEKGKVRLQGSRTVRWTPSSRSKIEAECLDGEMPLQHVVTGIMIREKSDDIKNFGLYLGKLK